MSGQNQWQTIHGKSGLLFREHPTRKYSRKPDRFWAIRHTVDGKRIVETLGWASEGWTADMAQNLLHELQRNAKLGTGPRTLAEKRVMAADVKEAEARRATLDSLRDITFGEMAEHYSKWARATLRDAERTIGRMAKHVLPVLGELRARTITPSVVNDLRMTLEAKRPERGRGQNTSTACLSPQTVLHCLKTVREVFNFARETAHPELPEAMLFTGPNPAILSHRGRGVRLPKSDARRLRILTDAEIALLLNFECLHISRREVFRDMVLFSMDTGVRVGELVRLRCEDVDPERGTVRIFSGSDSGLTKGGRTRIVHAGYLFPETTVLLRRLTDGTSGLLFPGENGAVRHVNSINHRFQRALDKLGINAGVTDARNKVVWHTLRHTFATRMLEAGVEIYTLKELMGHASVTTTEGYLHLIDRTKREQSLARLRVNITVPAHQ